MPLRCQLHLKLTMFKFLTCRNLTACITSSCPMLLSLVFKKGTYRMYSICCTLPEPDFKSELTKEELQQFGKLVCELRKQGHSLKSAQLIAYSEVMSDSVPFET